MFFLKNKKRKDIQSQEHNIDKEKLPKHIAIIMDGNGRWAKKRGLPRMAGHRAGVETLREVIRTSSDIGIEVLTLYAFSTENWKRPKNEVDALMNLLVEYLNKEVDELHRNNIKINAIGEIDTLPEKSKKAILDAMTLTGENTGLIVNVALNYGGRDELIHGFKDMLNAVQKGNLKIENINENTVENYLYTANLPDPDLLIRPGGEMRISNFLLWQLAYTEFCFTDILWPDFKKENLMEAIISYQVRDRRYGGI
ncbi:isoprenyl transferase [Irregularibacter muris]|uniref:Isoprenyl transferase n=1 Tax=Irregularibacter muris TaxID=1796619 RepID=A0AAE3HD37_9FIRM|nr:isoprenyl transferase [Irregularibacter muris]MCR1898116.1 isoprenyl transferase [Irregularibacter muris]